MKKGRNPAATNPPSGWPSTLSKLSFCDLRFLAEAFDVFGVFLHLDGSAALNEFADLLDDVGIRERGDVAGVHAIFDRGEHASHDFAGARLWHVRNHVDILGPRDFADHRLDGGRDLVLHGLAWQESGFQRNVDNGNAAFHFVHRRNHGGFGHFGNGEAGGFNFFGAEAVAGHVDDVIHAAENAIVAVGGKHGAVCGIIRPVAPIFAFRILAVLRVILTHETLGVAPDGLHNSRPGVADADVSGGARASFDLFSILVPNHGINSQRRRPGAAGFHRVYRRFGRAEKAARFGLPPGVHNHSLAFADYVVIPLPDFGFDGLANSGHVLEVVVVFFGFVRAGFAQHANGRRRSVEDIDVEPLRDAPRTANIRELRDAFVENAGGGQRKRAENNVGMSGDPADVRHAPVDVFGMNVLVILRSSGHVGEIASGAVLASFRFACGAAGVHQEERRFGILRNGLDGLAAIVFENVVDEKVAVRHHGRFGVVPEI